MRVVRVQTSRNWKGRRIYLVGHRVHHGATGCSLIALGMILAYHDRRDWRRWIADLVKEL